LNYKDVNKLSNKKMNLLLFINYFFRIVATKINELLDVNAQK